MLWTPRPYQEIARDFILDTPRCNLWLDCGLGKTSTVLAAVDLLWVAGSSYHPMLVLAPKRVARDVWSNECKKWSTFSSIVVSTIIGNEKERRWAALRPADVYTINYENIPWLVEFFGKKWPFKIVIADESTRLKGFRLRRGGKRAAALSKIAKLTGRWVNLTGTPLPNGPIDLWGQMWFLDYGARLGRTFTDFEARWFNKWNYQLTLRPGAKAEIMALVADLTISMRARDWFDVDETVPMPVYFDLPPRAQSVYDDMEAEMFAELDDDKSIEVFAPASKSGKCNQICNGAVYTDEQHNWSQVHDTKLHLLKDIADELGDQPLFVAYHFRHDKERLLKAFPKSKVFDSEQDRLDWNAGKIPMLLVHPGSAGHGLDFQDGGCVIVFFSQTWNLESRQQIIERIGPVRQHQAGHPRPVLVYDILARGTTDEIMHERVSTKADVQDVMRAYRDRKMK